MKSSQSFEGGEDMLPGSFAGPACFRPRSAVELGCTGQRESGSTVVRGRQGQAM